MTAMLKNMNHDDLLHLIDADLTLMDNCGFPEAKVKTMKELV